MTHYTAFPDAVRIVEVGPRDGLQNEKVQIPTSQKLQFIAMLADAGLPVVEATSFVRPQAIPQLSDAGEVMAGLHRLATTVYPVLVPNLKGMERAITAGVSLLLFLLRLAKALPITISTLPLQKVWPIFARLLPWPGRLVFPYGDISRQFLDVLMKVPLILNELCTLPMSYWLWV